MAPQLLLILLTVATYWPVCTAEFLFWDDHVNVSMNPDFSPPSFHSISAYWSGPHEYMYIPLTYTVWGMWSAISPAKPDTDGVRLNPYMFHTLNLALHLAATLVAYTLLLRLIKHDWAALAGAAIFSVHPVQVESVAWVTGLKDLLSGLLALAALWAYVCAVAPDEGTSQRSGKTTNWFLYALATVCFMASMLAKPSTVVVPLLAATLDLGWLGQAVRQSARRLLPWLLLTFPILLITRGAQGTQLQDFVTPLLDRPLIALDSLAFYFGKVLFPLHLCIDYARKPQWILHPPIAWATSGFTIAVAVCVWLLSRRAPWVGWSVLFFAIAVLPTSGLQPFAFQNFSTVTDHYLYLAMFGVGLLASSALIACSSMASRERLVCIIGATFIILLLAVRSLLQTRYWHDTVVLFTHAADVSPHSWIAQENVGRFVLADGDASASEQRFRAALLLRPGVARLHAELACALTAQKKDAEAVKEFRDALARDPNDPLPFILIGNLYMRQRKYADAATEYANALRGHGDDKILLQKYADAVAASRGQKIPERNDGKSDYYPR